MKRLMQLFLVMVLALMISIPALAAPVKVFLPEFRVTGAANRDELKASLPSLLASRLSTESTSIVDSPGGADLTIAGAYIAFGKIFSLDAQLKDNAGKVVGRAFEQGESADDIIPAVTRLAQKLNAELAKAIIPQGQPLPASTVATTPTQIQTPAPVPVSTTQVVATPALVVPQPPPEQTGDIVRPQNIAKAGERGYAEHQYIASFIAGAPVEDPQLIVLVSVRRPDMSLGKGYTGGAISAPVAGKIIEKTLTYLENRQGLQKGYLAADTPKSH